MLAATENAPTRAHARILYFHFFSVTVTSGTFSSDYQTITRDRQPFPSVTHLSQNPTRLYAAPLPRTPRLFAFQGVTDPVTDKQPLSVTLFLLETSTKQAACDSDREKAKSQRVCACARKETSRRRKHLSHRQHGCRNRHGLLSCGGGDVSLNRPRPPPKTTNFSVRRDGVPDFLQVETKGHSR